MEEDFLKRNWIFITVAGFLLGIALASIKLSLISGGLIFLIIAFALGMYTFFLVREYSLRNKFFSVSLLLLFVSLGIFRFSSAEIQPDPELESLVATKVQVLGVVVREPKEKETYREYVVHTDSGSTILVRATPFPQFQYGDRLSVSGKLELPKSFVTPQGTTFDYPAYLSKEGISYVMSFVSVEKVGEISAPIRKGLLGIKHAFMSSIERLIPYPESSLLGGILLGVDDSMGKDLLNAFRMVGIIHIVVLSGYNITLVADLVRKSLSFLSLRKALIGSTFGIILFVIMVGFSPSVVRAGLMSILALIARATHRNYNIARALALAAFCMVLWNPKVLLFDLGFQLSFLATIALIWISPIVQKKLLFLPEKFGFRDIAATTIATQLFVLPLLVYSSGMISLSGFVVNLLVLPVVPIIMIFGFITGLLGLGSFYLGFIPGIITHLFLSYVIWIAEYFSKIPWSVITVTYISVFVPIVFYVACACTALYITKERTALTAHSS